MKVLVPFVAFAAILLGLTGCQAPGTGRTHPDDAVFTYTACDNGVTVDLYKIGADRILLRGARPEVSLSPGGHFLRLRIEADAKVLGYRSAARASFPIRVFPRRTYTLQVEPVDERFDLTVLDTTYAAEAEATVVTEFSVPAIPLHEADAGPSLGR